MESRNNHDKEWCLQHNRSTLECVPAKQDHDRHECMFKQCREWLDQCFQNHADKHSMCHEPLAGGKFKYISPSRLIDVGKDGSKPRLVKFDNMEQIRAASGDVRYPGYITLSYCWGEISDKHHLLREENEIQFMLALPHLPKTLQEAIMICQRIGVKYIWIDAICIIQGHNNSNSSDWEWQSARVGSYYANSLFTIAAAWAHANDQGCLPIRSSNDPENERWNDQNLNRSPIAGFPECPLSRRGWVTQELSLAVRVLWMFEDCAKWSCSAGNFSQSGFSGGISTFQLFRLQMRLHWYTLLTAYAGTELSFVGDRLPAISGICKYIDPNDEDQYIAGIWRQSISRGLIWRGGDATHPVNNLPSWSPLSCIRGCSYLHSDYYGKLCSADEDCGICGAGKFKVHGLEMQHLYGDKHGKIQGARLIVEASLSSVYPQSPLMKTSGSTLNLASEDLVVSGEVHFDPTWQADCTDAMLICHGDGSDPVECATEGLYFFFLLLSQIEQDVYRRAGIFVSSRLKPSNPALAQICARVGSRRIVLI